MSTCAQAFDAECVEFWNPANPSETFSYRAWRRYWAERGSTIAWGHWAMRLPIPRCQDDTRAQASGR